MNVPEFRQTLDRHHDHELNFILPDGGRIPLHFHITEVGRTDRRFIDCGGQVRATSSCTLQAWVADDVEHRLTPASLAAILTKAATVLDTAELPVEIEYEDGILSQFPVVAAEADNRALYFHLGAKHTDCLAKEICLPNAGPANACCTPGGGCC